MADQYDALVSGSPTDKDSQLALAAQLRRQAVLGQLGMATGQENLSGVGKALYAGANTQAEQLSRQRESDNEQEQALQFHNDTQASKAAELAWQQKHGQDQLAQQMKIAGMNDARSRDELAQRHADRMAEIDEAAKDRATALASKGGKPLPIGAGKDIEQIMDAQRGVQATLDAFTAADAKKMQLGGPGRALKNTLAANTPFGTQEMEDVQNLWANYGRQFTLPELKNTIGVRHNEYMQNLFESYHLNPNMSNKQLLDNLNQINDQLKAKVSSRAKDFASQGYDVGDYADAITDMHGVDPQTGLSKKAAALLQQANTPPKPAAPPQPAPPAPAAPAPPQAPPPPTASVLPQAMAQPRPQQLPPGAVNSSMMAGIV